MAYINRIAGFVFLRLPYYLLYVLGIGYVAAIFRLADKESLELLNVSFPVVGILAGISFSWAQSLSAGDKKEKVLRASRLFFHSPVLLCLGCILKYLSFASIPGVTLVGPVVAAMKIFVFYAVCTSLAFFYGGLFTVGRYLWGK